MLTHLFGSISNYFWLETEKETGKICSGICNSLWNEAKYLNGHWMLQGVRNFVQYIYTEEQELLIDKSTT